MEGFFINLNKSTDQFPVSIEVSAKFDKKVVEQIKKVVAITDDLLCTHKSYFKADSIEMIRYSLPEVSNDQLSQIAWFIGEWYSRVNTLLTTHLN